jgi:hypothetical protein
MHPAHVSDIRTAPQPLDLSAGWRHEEAKAPAAPRGGAIRSWVGFWFTPADPVGLHALRVLAGLLFLSWLVTFAGRTEEFFSLSGWFDRQAYRDAARLADGMPVPAGWSVLHLCGSDPALLTVAYALSLAVLVLFTAGLATRVTGVLTWVVVASFIGNPAFSYGADYLLGIVAFYLMIGYVLLGQWSRPLSWPARLFGSRDTWLIGGRSAGPWCSHAANLTVRLLQVHFAIIVVVSGLHKLQFGDWWAGVAFWYPLHPPLETTLQSIRAHGDATSYLFFLSLTQYVLLAWQIGFPLFAWRRGWRPVLIVGALLGWAGSVLIYREPLSGPVLCIGCLSYLSAAEWRSALGWLAWPFRLPARARRGAPATEPQVPALAKVGMKS